MQLGFCTLCSRHFLWVTKEFSTQPYSKQSVSSHLQNSSCGLRASDSWWSPPVRHIVRPDKPEKGHSFSDLWVSEGVGILMSWLQMQMVAISFQRAGPWMPPSSASPWNVCSIDDMKQHVAASRHTFCGKGTDMWYSRVKQKGSTNLSLFYGAVWPNIVYCH